MHTNTLIPWTRFVPCPNLMSLYRLGHGFKKNLAMQIWYGYWYGPIYCTHQQTACAFFSTISKHKVDQVANQLWVPSSLMSSLTLFNHSHRTLLLQGTLIVGWSKSNVGGSSIFNRLALAEIEDLLKNTYRWVDLPDSWVLTLNFWDTHPSVLATLLPNLHPTLVLKIRYQKSSPNCRWFN